MTLIVTFLAQDRKKFVTLLCRDTATTRYEGYIRCNIRSEIQVMKRNVT